MLTVGQVVRVADAPGGGIVRALDYETNRVLVALNWSQTRWYPSKLVEVSA